MGRRNTESEKSQAIDTAQAATDAAAENKATVAAEKEDDLKAFRAKLIEAGNITAACLSKRGIVSEYDIRAAQTLIELYKTLNIHR